MHNVRLVAIAAVLTVVSCGGSDATEDVGTWIPPLDTIGYDESGNLDAVRPDVFGDVPDAVTPDQGSQDSAGQDLYGQDLAAHDLAGQDLTGQDLAGEDVPPFDAHILDYGYKDQNAYDMGNNQDFGWGDTTPGGCSPCGYGSISGVTCAVRTQTNMPFVKVWIDTTDCDGNAIHLETHSDGEGYYRIDGVPCGTQTVMMQKGSFSHMFSRYIDKGQVTNVTSNDGCVPPKIRIAVVTGKWDSIEDTLLRLWFHFRKFDGLMPEGGGTFTAAQLLMGEEVKDLLGNKAKLLDDFDVLFLNCGDSPDWIMSQSTDRAKILTTLRAFVHKGGSVYASDYAGAYLTNAWPAAWNGSWPHDFAGSVGTPRPVTAEILDTELAAYLKKQTAIVTFGLGPLTSITGSAPVGTTVHLRGPNSSYADAVQAFMISYEPEGVDGGRVVYTNFHNDEQEPTGDMAEILQYVVFLM
jgi:hypothetical protein